MGYTLVSFEVVPLPGGMSGEAGRTLHAMWGACTMSPAGGRLRDEEWEAFGSPAVRAEILGWRLAYRDPDNAAVRAWARGEPVIRPGA